VELPLLSFQPNKLLDLKFQLHSFKFQSLNFIKSIGCYPDTISPVQQVDNLQKDADKSKSPGQLLGNGGRLAVSKESRWLNSNKSETEPSVLVADGAGIRPATFFSQRFFAQKGRKCLPKFLFCRLLRRKRTL
jgi:hypothetical protein